jgi:hypothetical protein
MLSLPAGPQLFARSPASLAHFEFNAPTAVHTQRLLAQAQKIEKYRANNSLGYVAAILENMGFEKSKSSGITRAIRALQSGEMDFEVASRTSELGSILREFGHREKAFEAIGRHGQAVSEITIDDVSRPVSVELRSKAEKQALEAIKKRPVAQQSCEGVLQKITGGISRVATRILHALDYLNTKVLNLPGALAQETETKRTSDDFRQDCTAIFHDDFTPDQEQHLQRLIADSEKEIQREVKRAEGKKVVLVQGPTGAGKGTFINFLFSEKCRFSRGNVICDKSPVPTAGCTQSHTRYVKVLPLDGDLEKVFGSNAAIVDSPGFHDTRPNRLHSLVYALYASKAAVEIQKRPHISVYLLDYSSFNSERGRTPREMKEIIERSDQGSKVIVITKTELMANFQSSTRQTHNVKPFKEDIKNALVKLSYSESSVDQVILFDVMEEEIASHCEINHKGKYECIPGGGTHRKQILEQFHKMLATVPTSQNQKHVVDLTVRDALGDLQKKLEGFLTSSTTLNFGPFSQKYQRFAVLLKIGHPSLDAIQDRIRTVIGDKLQLILSEINNLARNILDEGNEFVVSDLLKKIESLNAFTSIGSGLLKVKISDKKTEIGKEIQAKCKEKIFEILGQQSNWDDSDTQKKMKLAFKLLGIIEERLSISPSFYEKQIKPELDELLKKTEEGYYKSLWTCSFPAAEDRKVKFGKLKAFLRNAKAEYFYGRELASYEALREKHIALQSWETKKSIAKATGVAVALGATWYFSGPAILAAKALMSTKFFAALGTAEKTAALVKTLWAAKDGATVVTLGLGAAQTTEALVDVTIDQFTNALCQAAWLETGFDAQVPPPWLNPST